MSQDDLIISNQTFPATRTDINANLQALGSLMSGSSAPGTTYAYMWWADTTNGVLKQRDASNAAWVIRATLSDDRVVTKTTSYTTVLGDYGKLLACSASGGSFSVTLIAAATAGDGFQLEIMKTDSSTNTVTIDGNASETIDGGTTMVLASQYDKVILRCDGSNWLVIGLSRKPTNAEMESETSIRKAVQPDQVARNPGVSKVWARVTYSGGTPSLQESYNVTSITDTGVGQCTITIATDFSSAGYAPWANSAVAYQTASPGNIAAGSYIVEIRDTNDGTSFALSDQNFFTGAFGDQT